MSNRSGFFPGLVVGLVLCSAAGATYWISTAEKKSETSKEAPPAPAKVAKPLKEETINTVSLSPEAIERLGLRTGTVEEKPVRRTRTYSGEITIPAGRAIVVSAPLSGVVRALPEGTPGAGENVRAGQPIFQLMPLLTPEARANLTTSAVEATQQVKAAQTQVGASQVAFERARRVFQSDAGSRRAVDEAQAQYELAQRGLEAAKARDRQMKEVLGEIDQGTAAPIAIKSPESGLLRNVSALPGQNVPSGAPLFEVIDLSRLWVRVAVYVGDVDEIDADAAASVGNLAGSTGNLQYSVKPVAAPPSANSMAGTVDFYYGIENPESHFRPGHRVAVQLPLKSEETSLVAPWSSIVYDIYGGTWVYEETAERTFVRRRVTLRYMHDGLAVLSNGPSPGTKVVVAGAAELFGAETGFTK